MIERGSRAGGFAENDPRIVVVLAIFVAFVLLTSRDMVHWIVVPIVAVLVGGARIFRSWRARSD
jgi:hypothetical protein